jgi:hypothetical protein
LDSKYLEIIGRFRNTPKFIVRNDGGQYYVISNNELNRATEVLDLSEGMLDEGWLQNTTLTLGLILSMFAATGQNTNKIEKVKDTVTKQAPTELVQQIQQNKDKIKQDPRFAGWGDEALDKIFDFTPDAEKSRPRELPDLNLGGYTHIAKISNKNHQRDSDIEYTVDISDKRYLQSNIFSKIKEFNSELNGVEINFTYNGTPLPGKSIKL